MPPANHCSIAVRLTRRWVRHYTRGLPGDSGARRVAEIESDLHDQALDAGQRGTRTPGAAILWRAVRGIPSDISWRRQERSMITQTRISPFAIAWAAVRQSWFAPLAALVGVFDVFLVFFVATEAAGKMPGRAIGSVVMGLLAIGLFVGLWLRLRVSQAVTSAPSSIEPRLTRTPGTLTLLMVVALVPALMVSFAVGSLIPIGLVLLGLVVLTPARSVVRNTIRATDLRDRAPLAEGLIIAGTLPALAMFWMVVPAIAACIVIAGVLGSGPQLRSA